MENPFNSIQKIKIQIYSTKSCTYCKQAKTYFDSKGLDYQVYNVDEDESKLLELEAMGFRSVPVIVINGQIIKGFNKNILDDILDKK